MFVRKIFRDPLTHFLLGGLLIYCVLSWGEDTIQADEIHITHQTLLDHIQFRTKTFNPDFAQNKLDGMSNAEIADMVSAIKTEEALYREAQSLGLEQGDYVIRQRLVGKIKFLTEGATVSANASTTDLESFFQSNKSDYRSPGKLSLIHIYFENDNTSPQSSAQRARETLKVLIKDNIDDDGAKNFGDRFLFNDFYTGRPQSYLEQQFGIEMTTKLFSASMPLRRWDGPYTSEYGSHLVFITQRSSETEPTFSEVRQQVALDYERQQKRTLEKAMEKRIVESYRITYSPEVSSLLPPKP